MASVMDDINKKLVEEGKILPQGGQLQNNPEPEWSYGINQLGTNGSINVGNATINTSGKYKVDPFSPTVTGAPVVVTDTNGNRIGNVWAPDKNGLGDALRSLEKGQSTGLYLDLKTGEFSNSPKSTMTYKDGKINLNVSSDISNTDWYKNLIHSDNFKQLSELYAQDPTGESKINITRKGENGEDIEESKSINDLLREFAEQLEKSSNDYKGFIDTRENTKRLTGGAIDLTDEDIITMGAYQNFTKENYTENDTVFLPDVLKKYFSGYETYNEESGAISAKDFYENFYHLDREPTDSLRDIIDELGETVDGLGFDSDKERTQQIGESDKDYAIDLVRTRVSETMTDLVRELTFNKDTLTPEDKAYAASQYARCVNLYQLANRDAPNADSWTGFNLAVQNVATGFTDGVLTAGEGIEHFFGQIVSGAMDAGIRTAAAINAPFAWLGDLFDNFFKGGIEGVAQNTKNMYEYFDEWYTQNTDDRSALGEMRESLDELGKAMENREDLAGALFQSQEYDLARSYADAAAMQQIGRIGGLILTQIVATNPIGSTVGGIFEAGLSQSLAVATTGYHLSTLANMTKVFTAFATTANTASQAIQYLNVLNRIKAVSSVAGFLANIGIQGVVDTFIENPALTDALLAGEDNGTVAEFQDELRKNILWNTLGEAMPTMLRGGKKGALKINKAIANTKPGAIAQAMARKTVNWFTIKGRKAYEGVAEFMTRRSKEYIVEDAGADAPFSGKVNPEKRWQNLRKEIIAVQEDIKKTKIFSGDGSWSENAKKIDELVQARIDLEETLGISKKLFTIQAKNRIIKNAGLDIEVAETSEYTAKLTSLSKKIGQANLPGSFSRETGDYINDLFNLNRILNKQSFLESNGKTLSKGEAASLDVLTKRISDYESNIPAELLDSYKRAVQDYMNANYRYYYKLNTYLASDAGGNIIPKDKLEGMRANNQYGVRGDKYMPLYGVGGFSGAGDLEALLANPANVVREGKTKVQVETFSRKSFSSDVTYLDPNYTRDLVTNAYAQVSNAADMTDAIVRAGRTTSIPTDSKGNILKTPDAVQKAKDSLFNDLKKKFESSFRENRRRLGIKTVDTTKTSAKKYYGAIKRRSQRTINEILGLDQAGLKRYASTLNSSEIEQINKVYSLPAYSRKVRTRAELDAMYNSLSDAQKKIVDKALLGNNLTIGSWNDAVTNNNLDVLLSRQYIKDNKGILKSSFYKDLVGNARATELEADEALALKTAKAELESAEEGIKANKLVKPEEDTPLSEQYKTEMAKNKKFEAQKKRDFKTAVRGTITDAVDATVVALEDNPYLEQLIKEYEKIGISSDAAKQYIIYQWLYDNKNANGVVQEIAFNYYNAPSKVSGIKISTDAASNYSKKFRAAADSIIESKLNKTIAKIQEEGTEGLVDIESTAARVEKYFKDITDLWESKQLVEAWDREAGQFKYYKVDHSTYTLVTNYPTFKRNNLFARTMARINSIARIGQITLRAASLVTQGFKDTFNALVLGGWDELLLDNPATYKKIAEYISPEVVEAFSKEMSPEAWKDFIATAEWQGLSVEEAIAKAETNNELLATKIKGGPGTSASYYSYRSLYEPTDETVSRVEAQISASKDTWDNSMKTKWNEARDKAQVTLYGFSQKRRAFFDKAQDGVNILHNARENFLRKQVYRQNFINALENGKSLSQARNYAQFFMENATTNFSRGFAWGSNIVRSIPYFGAMVNGASSMVRLLEVDPLGIMTRFTTDLIIPVIGLTVMSLENESDAEIYRNIPEYEKEGNMHWVVDGQVYTIPLPEELSKFVLPIRHAVEKIAKANGNAWHELLLNDLLNMPTIPLNAVMMLDEKKLVGDPSVADRISALAMDMFNTLAPNAARTAYIAVTGKDPYTGEDYGRQKWYVDENGEYQLMAISEYDFANDMANLFKSWGWNVSAVMAEALFSSIFGAGSLDIAEGVRDLSVSIQENEPDFTALLTPSMERAGNVLTGTRRTDEKQAQIAWYGLYYELKDKKNELLSPDGKLAKYAQDIDKAKDSATLSKKTELYNSEVRNWQDFAMSKIKQYNSQYGNFFDRAKFAGALSMLTAQLSIDNVRNSDQYYNARALAVETMVDAGFDSPSDMSIFGYAYRDKESGRITIKYTDPLIISMSKNMLWYQGDEAVQNINDVLEFSGLKDKYKDEIYPAYNNYMKTKNYVEANKLAAGWDVEVVEAIKPIIDQYNVGNLLDKADIIDVLDNYILVPSTTDAMGKGKYYSSSTGLNKRRGYAQSYIKKIYNRLDKEK